MNQYVSITGLDPEAVAERLEPLPITDLPPLSRYPDVVVRKLSDESDPPAALLEIRKLLKDDGQEEAFFGGLKKGA